MKKKSISPKGRTLIRLGHHMPQPRTLLPPLLTPRKPEIIRRLLRTRAHIHHIGFNAYVLHSQGG